MKEVIKKWGKEVWIVNEPEYCAKFLHVDRGASGSLHYHPKKKETFFLLEGEIKVEYDDFILRFVIGEWPTPLNIPPCSPHRFTGIADSVILEVSTHHDDDDVVRLEPSRSANE